MAPDYYERPRLTLAPRSWGGKPIMKMYGRQFGAFTAHAADAA
jgi:hypothetical protein